MNKVTFFLVALFFVVSAAAGKPSFTFQLKDKRFDDSNNTIDLTNPAETTPKVWGKAELTQTEEADRNNEDAEHVGRLVASRREVEVQSLAANDAEKSILSILEEIRETKRELQKEMEALRAEASDLMAV